MDLNSIQGLSKDSSFFTLFLPSLVFQAPSTLILSGCVSAILSLPALLQNETEMLVLHTGSFFSPLEGSWRLFLSALHISPHGWVHSLSGCGTFPTLFRKYLLMFVSHSTICFPNMTEHFQINSFDLLKGFPWPYSAPETFPLTLLLYIFTASHKNWIPLNSLNKPHFYSCPGQPWAWQNQTGHLMVRWELSYFIYFHYKENSITVFIISVHDTNP